MLILLLSCTNSLTPNKNTLKAEPELKSELIDMAMEKFDPQFTFSDFPILNSVSKNHKLKLNTNLNSFTNRYRTMIKQSYEDGKVNFGGKYIVNYWGCGSPCQVGVAINVESGGIIELPTASLGYEFQRNSRLLILNPPDSLNNYIKDCSYCTPELYYLDTIKGEFISKQSEN